MTREEAIQVALDILYSQIEIPEEDQIVCTHIEATDEGWYLECNSRIFVETDDLSYALVIAPLLVRPDGSHRFIF